MSIEIEDYMNIQDPITIDIRDKDQYNSKHIPNAINVPMEKLIVEPDKYLTRSKTYYIYCQKGIVTKTVCEILSKQSYNVIELNRGYEGWLIYNTKS